MAELSRRKFIWVGGAAVMTQAALAAPHKLPVPQESPTGILNGGDRQLVAVLPSSATFGSEVDALFKGLLASAQFRPLKAATILLRNVSDHAIRALSIAWSIETPSGPLDITRFFYSRPTSRGISARQSIVKPGSTVLVSPLFLWSPYNAGPAMRNLNLSLHRTVGRKTVVEALKSATSVIPRIDAVIYFDWKMLGADAGSLSKHLIARRNAEHDEAVSIFKAIEAGADQRLVMQRLRQHGSGKAIVGFSGTKYELRNTPYFQFRSLQAKMLAKAAQSKSDSDFRNLLLTIKSVPRTSIELISG